VRKDYNRISIKKILWFILHFIGKIISSENIINFFVLGIKMTDKYDVAISFSNDIYNKGTNLGCNIFTDKVVTAKRKIAWIHNEPYRLGFTKKKCLKTYKNFDKIVNVSYACKRMLDNIIPAYRNKSKVVYNMLNEDKIQSMLKEGNPYDNKRFHLVTIARLNNEQKRIDRVIKCCEKLKLKSEINFQWHVIGDGPDKKKLEILSAEHKTEDVVIFEGEKDNPYPYIKYADIFVQTSDYEAYSMVLLEALILEKPIICTNYDSATEIIKNGKNGVIVEKDEEEIINAIKILMEEPEKIKQIKNYIKTNTINNTNALKQFEEVIE